jgi:membrane protease YdiL (CAAX protease family)
MLSYITTYGIMLFYYSLFLIAVITCFRSGGGQLKEILTGKSEAGILFSQLISGIFFLGIGAASLFAKRNIEVDIFIPSWSGYYTPFWILIDAAIITGTLSASKKIFSSDNSHPFPPHYLPLSFVFVRTLFLIIYEFFFRGAVLFIMTEDFGIVVAVIVNLVLYAPLHWFDKRERYSSIIMGIILCTVSIYYHSVWPAILIHLSLALGHEITLLTNNRSLIKKSWS